MSLNNHLTILFVFIILFALHNNQEADCSEYKIKIDELNSKIETLQAKMKSLILENEELKEWKRKKEEEEKKKEEEEEEQEEKDENEDLIYEKLNSRTIENKEEFSLL